VRRYEREHPGELIHIDIKKLGRFERVGHRITGDHIGQSNSRGFGWEFVHVSIDDASRVAFTRIMQDEKAVSAVAVLKATGAREGEGSISRAIVGHDARDFDAEDANQALYAENQRKSRTLHLDGAARMGEADQRFQQAKPIGMGGYARAYRTSDQRAAELPIWTHQYNWHRPHGSLRSNPPISRLGLSEDNLLRLHS